MDQFQSDYGGDSEVVTLLGGGHAPYYEAVREDFWDEFFAFLADD